MTVYGLIDCNSFYCSCQRAFEPRLKRLPVVVLSNNDGCAIARTKEAKALGIKMGEPWHLVREQRKLSGVQWYSSNYPLYADMSRRVYQVLLDHAPRVEPYSIDEMFLDLTGLPGDLSQRCDDMRAAVEQITKIPTCVGWGPTKTIAKLANYIAKDRPEMEGLCDLTDEHVRKRFYRNLPVSEVWGIGRRLAARLDDTGIRTIAQFVNAPPAHIRKIAAIIGVRLQAELRGESCLQLSEVAAQRKGLACTRSFGRPISTYSDLSEAVTGFAVRAAEKLRAEKLDAAHVSVFIQTNRHKRDEGWYANQASLTCAPTSNTLALTAIAMRLLRTIWKDGFRYAKAGVMLNDLAPAGTQHTLFDIPSEQDTALMDAITAKYKQRLSGSSLEEANRSIDQHIALQQKLIDIGYLPAGSKADGVYGEATRQAIATWQRVNRMPSSDGILSDKDANVLLSSSQQPRTRNADYSAVNPVGEQDEAPASPHYRNFTTSTEDRLIAIVDEGRTEYENGANDFLKGASRPRRAQKICALMTTPEAQSWVGTIEELSSNSSGYGVLKIRISPNITVGTSNNSFSDALSQQKTLISPNDPVFSQVANLQVGQSVRFSGRFNTSTDDCLSEKSLTQGGSMRSPDFEIHFTDVRPSN